MSESILIPLMVVGVVVVLAVLAGLVLVVRDPRAASRRVEALFRRPPKPPRTPGPDHYYKPYWS